MHAYGCAGRPARRARRPGDARARATGTMGWMTATIPGRKPPADRASSRFPDSRVDAILVVSFGGPEGLDDVVPFLENVTRGRGVPPERLADVAGHYAQFGGVSPINAQNRAL